MTGVLIRDRKERFETQKHTEKKVMKSQKHNHKSKNVKGCQQPPEDMKEAWNRATQPPEGTNPDDTLVLGFRPSELWKSKFLLL